MARPRTAPQRRISSRLDQALVERIEAWRLAHPKPPTQTAALEELIERGLKRAMRQRPKRKS
jgi:hypothetical protein